MVQDLQQGSPGVIAGKFTLFPTTMEYAYKIKCPASLATLNGAMRYRPQRSTMRTLMTSHSAENGIDFTAQNQL
jgi:hypothetical protein